MDNEALSYFPNLLVPQLSRERLMALYRDVLDIQSEAVVAISTVDAMNAVLANLRFDIDAAMALTTEYLVALKQSKRAIPSPGIINAHLFTKVILEDLYKNEEVHEDFYPTSPGLDDPQGMDAVFTEFNLPGEFEGEEF